jgi:hypothetical protein
MLPFREQDLHVPREKILRRVAGETDKGGREMNFFIAGITGLVLVLGTTAAYAPETGPLDRGRIYDVAYCIEENGRIVDNSGASKGWMVGDEVYDNAWNLKYRMEGKSLREVSAIEE